LSAVQVKSIHAVPLETLRDAIADALWIVSAHDLPAVCERLGLRAGDVAEAFRSKRKYVRLRLAGHKGDELLALARQILVEFNRPALADFFSELTTHAEHRVTDLTRRAVLSALDDVVPLFGDLPVFDGLSVLSPTWSQSSEFDGPFKTLQDDVQRHYVDNDDYTNAHLLERCGALTCSQQRFFDLIEKVLDPVCRRGSTQAALAEALASSLAADGFALPVIGELSRHPVYGVRRIAAGVKGAPKNLIFAAINAKPDLYFTDAINNDVAITNKSDALIYDRLLPDSGLTWAAMAAWWQELHKSQEATVAKRGLYRRLRDAVIATRSPGEFVLFDTYYREFVPQYKDTLPALIPQVYLHYDPRTAAQRGFEPVLPRQRMDLLLLLDRSVRVVIEVDGKHHYADGATASPTKYAGMVSEDRLLRLRGYEIYRFGAAEFSDTEVEGERIRIGPGSRALVSRFFRELFARRGVTP
jgi:hypothetical protein